MQILLTLVHPQLISVTECSGSRWKKREGREERIEASVEGCGVDSRVGFVLSGWVDGIAVEGEEQEVEKVGEILAIE